MQTTTHFWHFGQFFLQFPGNCMTRNMAYKFVKIYSFRPPREPDFRKKIENFLKNGHLPNIEEFLPKGLKEQQSGKST